MTRPARQRHAWPWVLLATLLTAAPLAADAVKVVPGLPKWARAPTTPGPGAWKDYQKKQGADNQAAMAALNAAGLRPDFLLYGDSITTLIGRLSGPDWAALFPPAGGWVASRPFGVSGSDTQDLAWRIIGGGERPKLSPKVVALLIGTNDVNQGRSLKDLESKVDYLLKWWAAAHPTTKVILLALLPTGGEYDTLPASLMYRKLAAARRVTYVDCRGAIGDPFDLSVLYDGVHPTTATSAKLLRCLAPTVYRLAGKAGPALSPPPPPPRPRPPPRSPRPAAAPPPRPSPPPPPPSPSPPTQDTPELNPSSPTPTPPAFEQA